MSDQNTKNINFYKLIGLLGMGGGPALVHIIHELTGQAPTEEEAQAITDSADIIINALFSPAGLVIAVIGLFAYFGFTLLEKAKQSASPAQQKRIDSAVAMANKAIGMANQYKKENLILADKMKEMEFNQAVEEAVNKRLNQT